jgi:hypothetical protein
LLLKAVAWACTAPDELLDELELLEELELLLDELLEDELLDELLELVPPL